MPLSDSHGPVRSVYGRILRWVLWSFLALVLGVVSCFALIQTRMGKDLLVSWVGRAVETGTGMALHIEGLQGFIPFDFVVGTAVLGEESDPWLRVEGLSFKWFPKALMTRRIHIGRLEAAEVEVLRRPPESASSPKTTRPSRPARQAWPISLPPVLLERFLVDRLFLDGSVIGEEAEFTASGRMTVTGGGETVQGEFRVRRLDASEEMAGLRWVLNTSPLHLELDLQLIEPGTGALSRLAGVRPGASRLRVSGKGPPDDWQGEMEVETGAWGSIWCDLQVDAARDRMSVKAGGDFELNEDLIKEAATVFPGIAAGGFSLSASVSDEGVASIERLALTLDGMDSEISGLFDIGKGSGEARLDLTVPELGRYESPDFPVSTGRLHARLNLQGRFDAPFADLHAEVAGLHADGVNIGSAKGSLLLRPEQGEDVPSLQALQIQGEGLFCDASFEAGDRTLFRQRVDWDLNMRFTSMDMLSVSHLRVSDGNLDADFSGPVRLDDRSLDGRVRIRVEDLAKLPFDEESGIGVKGSGSLTALVQADAIRRSVHMDVNGRMQDIGPIPVELNPLVGDGGEFRGGVTVKEGRTVGFSNFRAIFPGFEFDVNGNADLVQETGNISILATIPDAGVLSSAAGRPVGGMVTLKAGINGGFRDPNADVELNIQDFELDTVPIGHVQATLHARHILPEPEGRINLKIVHEDLEVAAGADVDLDMPFLRLHDMWIQEAGSRVSGGLAVHIPSGVAQGDLNGSLEDLAPMAAVLNMELDGRCAFLLRLSKKDEVQDIGLELQLDDFRSFAGRARRIQLRGEARDVLGEAEGEVYIGVTGFNHGDAVVEKLAINARGRFGAINVEADASGVLKEPFRVSSEGLVRWSEHARLLNLESLKVEFGSHGLRLADPAEIRLLPENGIETTPLVLHADSGRLKIEGRMAEQIEMAVDFEEIPLALLALAGRPPMDGLVAGSLRLFGTAQKPMVEAELVAEGAGFPDPALRHIPRFRVSSSASLGGGRMEVRLTLDDEESRPIEAFVATPANLSLSPLSMDFPEQGDIEGRVAADLDLGPVPAWFLMDGLRLSGRLMADVSISGSVASPVVRGDVHVRDGTFDVLKSGTIFREVDVHVRVSGKDLILEQARAVDGSGGTIDVEGRVRPLVEAGFPFEGRLRMDSFHVVRLDDLTAVAGGELEISGTTGKADLSGIVRVASAEVRIPDRLPPKIQELEVVEVNGMSAGDSIGEQEPGEAEAGSSSGFEVDLNVDIEIPGRTYVRGHGLDSEWKGALRVSGTATRPEVRGELTIVRGHYDFFGERFSLASGNVILDGSHPPEPLMNVTAERRKAGMTGRVILSGRPSTLSVEVTSDPPMPQDEVMARLLFGRSLTTITPIQALKLARAMDSLAGGRTFGFLDRAQRAVGLDQVELVQTDDQEGSTALSLGRYVSEGAYVAVEKGLGTDEGRVSVEYEVTPRITVQTDVGADAAGGVEVKWKWDY